MKLLVEQITDINMLYEAEGDKKSLFIEGIFLQGDIKNRNGRIYPKNILDKEVKRYMKESVARKNSFGELNHPTGPSPWLAAWLPPSWWTPRRGPTARRPFIRRWDSNTSGSSSARTRLRSAAKRARD